MALTYEMLEFRGLKYKTENVTVRWWHQASFTMHRLNGFFSIFTFSWLTLKSSLINAFSGVTQIFDHGIIWKTNSFILALKVTEKMLQRDLRSGMWEQKEIFVIYPRDGIFHGKIIVFSRPRWVIDTLGFPKIRRSGPSIHEHGKFSRRGGGVTIFAHASQIFEKYT